MRISKFLTLSLATIGVAAAGTIPVNLITTNVTVATCASTGTCTASGSGFGAATGNSSGGYMNQTYATVNGATAPGNRPATDFSATGVSTPTNTITTSAPSIPFDFQTNSLGKQIFLGNTANTDYQIVVNLGSGTGGVFGISAIDTMIQANSISTGSTIVITAAGVDGSGNAITDQIVMNPGVDYRGINSNQTILMTADGSGIAQGGGTIGSTNTYNTGNVGVGTVANSVKVYNDAFGTEVKTTNSVNYYTDVQQIILGSAFLNGYLDNVTITSLAAPSGTQQLIFSALSLSTPTSATPEPSTTVLIGLGIGALVWMTSRRSRAKV